MITLAIEKKGIVYVYGENKQQLFTVTGELYGYNSNTVSVKRGRFICVYDDKESTISTRLAK